MKRFRAKPTLHVSDQPACHEVAEVLQSYLDGELAPTDADRVAQHLSHCHRCDIEAATVQQVIDAIRRQRPTIDAGALVRLTEAIDVLGQPDQPDRPDQHRRPWS